MKRVVRSMLQPNLLQRVRPEDLGDIRDISIRYVGAAKWNKAVDDLVKERPDLASVLEYA